MKQNRIVLGVAALVAAGMLPWPALGQEVGQQTVPGKESPAEKTAEKESEKPADKAAEQASGKKTDGDWGFRWDGRPSLHLGEGTRVDFRVRLQHEIWHSDATLSLDDDSDVETTTTSVPMSLAGASASRARSSTSSTIRSSESSRPTEIPGATSI